MPLFLKLLIVFVWALPAQAEVVVTASPLTELASAVESTYPANVEPLDTGLISAGIGSEILKMHARVGDAVVQGQQLVSLDCRDATLSESLAREVLAEASEQLAFAQRQAERVAKLAASNIASEELKDTRATEVLFAQRRLAKAQLSLDDAQLHTSRCDVRAPFDAVVTGELAFVGTRVAVGAPIMELVSQDVEVRARLPLDVRAITTETVQFTSPLGDVPLTLKSTAQSVDTETGTRLVRFVGDSALLEPGIPGRIRIQTRGLQLSADYLVERSGQLGVMLVEESTARFVPRPNAALGQPIDVSDLSPRALVVRDGRFRVRDGETVVVNP